MSPHQTSANSTQAPAWTAFKRRLAAWWRHDAGTYIVLVVVVAVYIGMSWLPPPRVIGWFPAAGAGACLVLAAVSWGLRHKMDRFGPSQITDAGEDEAPEWRMFNVLSAAFLVLAMGFAAFLLFSKPVDVCYEEKGVHALRNIGFSCTPTQKWEIWSLRPVFERRGTDKLDFPSQIFLVIFVTWGLLSLPLLITEYMLTSSGQDNIGMTARYELLFAEKFPNIYKRIKWHPSLIVQFMLWLGIYLAIPALLRNVSESLHQRRWAQLFQSIVASLLAWLPVLNICVIYYQVDHLWRWLGYELIALWLLFGGFVISNPTLPKGLMRRFKHLASVYVFVLFILSVVMDVSGAKGFIYWLNVNINLSWLKDIHPHTLGATPLVLAILATLLSYQFLSTWSRRIDSAALSIENHHQRMLAEVGGTQLGARLTHVVSNRLLPVSTAFDMTRQIVLPWLEQPEQVPPPYHLALLQEQLAAGQSALERLHQRLADLKVSQRRNNDPIWFRLRDHVSQLAEQFRTGHPGQTVQLSVSWSPDLPSNLELLASPSTMDEIWGNLIENAKEAVMPQVARMELQVLPSDGGRVLLVLTDDGPGIPAKAYPHLTEAFYSTKAQGSGMGLYVVEQCAQALGARFQVHPAAKPDPGYAGLSMPDRTPTPMRGAQFVLQLPLQRIRNTSLN